MFIANAPDLDLLTRILVLGPIALVIVLAATKIVGLRTFSKMTAFDFVTTVAIGSLLIVSNSGLTHGRGLYATEVEAQRRSEQIGCATTHQIKDRWMPCSDERELHQQLRKQ